MEKGKSDECRCYGSPAGKAQQPDPSACPPKPQEPTRPCCPCPCPAEKCKVTLRTVKTLINAENKDVELSELLGGITILEERRPKKKIIDMYDATSSTNRAEPENDVNPHYLAYIMSSIENGLSMKTDPIEVYEHLFSKGNEDAPLVALGPAAAISTEDMVVPLSAPTAVNWTDPEMVDGARLDNIGPRANVAVTEASSVSDADDLRVLLGGGTGGGGGGGGGRSTVSADRQEDGGDPPPRDMLLETRAPTQSAAVLRGSVPPAWFPGFNVALPNTAQPALEADPEAVLDDAWFHSQPLALALDGKTVKLIGS